MALVLADRVKETTTTTGTGTYTLAGAVTGFESFATIGNTNTTYYCCTDGTDFEVGVGTYASSGTTLARTTILQSSNSDNAVNWSTGTRSIFCTQPAEKAVFLDGNGNVALGGDLTLSNAGDVTLTLEADTDNATESDNPSLVLSQDGGGTVSKLKLGSGNSTILEAHTNGSLILQSTNGDDFLVANQNGAVELYHDASKKLETTADGINVTSTTDNGPIIDLISDDPSDATDFGYEGVIRFFAENDASESTLFAAIRQRTADVSDGTENGSIYFGLTINGTFSDQYAMLDGGFFLLNDNSYIEFNTTRGTNFDVQLYPATPTADRQITLPDATGEVVLKDSSDVVTITSTDAGAGAGPDVSLYRNSASPATNDDLGEITFDGNDDAGTKIEYARIDARTVDVSSSNPDGQLDIAVTRNGVSTVYQRMAFSLAQFYQSIYLGINLSIIFEGTAYNDFEIYLTAANPTADRTITLPDATGTVLTTGNSDTPTTTTSSSDADFVLVDDGGTMKKITPANLGITAGAASTDDATALAIALG